MSALQTQFDGFIKSKETVSFSELEAFYEQLAPVTNNEMHGEWRGGYITSGGFIDFTLKDFGFYGWIGKHFHSDDRVYALMHQLFGFQFNFPLIGGARIREIDYRGKVSSAMIYNHLPIIDHFRRVDDDTLMGVMDVKGKTVLYFYLYR